MTAETTTMPRIPRRNGFRAVLAVAIVGHAAAALLYAVLLPDTSVRRAVYFGSKLVINALPVVWVFAIERRRMRFLRPSANAIVSGVCTGLVIGGAILLFYHSAIAGRLDATGLRARVGAYGMLDHFFLFAAFICVANSGMEEYYWRWFVFAGLKREMDWPWAVVVSAAGFTLHHIVVLAAYFSGAGLIVLCNLGVFVGGCIWAAQYHRTGSIYATWASHLIADAAIMVVAYDLLIGPVVP